MSLHWLMALLILLAYIFVYSAHWLAVPQSEQWRWLVRAHVQTGLLAGLLVVVRIAWRLGTPRFSGAAAPPLERTLALTTHALLYFLMVMQPLTGWLGSSLTRQFLGLVTVEPFKNTALYDAIVTRSLGLTWEQFEPIPDWFHKDFAGRYVFWILIALHIGAALYHHFVRRDDVLRRMLPLRTGRL